MLTRKRPTQPQLPYMERIRRYNEEKQSALLIATTPEEIERICYILRKKWNV